MSTEMETLIYFIIQLYIAIQLCKSLYYSEKVEHNKEIPTNFKLSLLITSCIAWDFIKAFVDYLKYIFTP